jgi:rRNA-processing protein FCF1
MVTCQSLANTLKIQLDEFQDMMRKFLHGVPICRIQNDPFGSVVFIGPSHYFGKITGTNIKLQEDLIQKYRAFYERFSIAFHKSSQNQRDEFEKTNKFITSWVEQKEIGWSVPETTEKAVSVITERIQTYREALDGIAEDQQGSSILVIDTNSLVRVPDFSKYRAIIGDDSFQIILVPTVLAELDKLKIVHREATFRDKVNSVITRIKGLRNQGSLLKGVVIHKNITVSMLPVEPDFSRTLRWLDPNNADDRVIATALEVQNFHPAANVFLVTSDINLQNKAEMANLPYREPPDE